MKIIILSLISVIFIFSSQVDDNNEEGLVYFATFEIEYIFGFTETSIEYFGDKFKINKTNFVSLLKDNKEELRYDWSPLRAKVIFSGSDVYYINQKGVVKHGDKFYIVDKEGFKRELKYISCSERDQEYVRRGYQKKSKDCTG